MLEKTRKIIWSVLLGVALVYACIPGYALAQSLGFGDPGSEKGDSGAPDLVASNEEIEGGTLNVGSTAQIIALFQNSGSFPVNIVDVQLYPSSNVAVSIAENQCSRSPLPSKAECAIIVSAKALQAGDWRIEMLVGHNGQSRLSTATISGEIETPDEGESDFVQSDFQINPGEQLDFGTLNNRSTLVRPVTITNKTTEPIEILNVELEAAQNSGLSIRSECRILLPAEACVVSVKWEPLKTGPINGILLVKHDGASAVAQIDITGEYDPDVVSSATIYPEPIAGKGLLISSLEQVDFEEDVDSPSIITLSLINVGDDLVNLNNIELPNTDNGLSLEKMGCMLRDSLEPYEACILTVKWVPSRPGPIITDILVEHDGARGTLVVPVRGEAASAFNKSQLAISNTGVEGMFEIDEAVLGVDIEEEGNRSAARGGPAGRNAFNALDAAETSLDGFFITSLSASRAVISGPTGSKIVTDDEKIILGGSLWTPKILEDGIELRNKTQSFLLVFDKSLPVRGSNRTSTVTSTDNTSEGEDTDS